MRPTGSNNPRHSERPQGTRTAERRARRSQLHLQTCCPRQHCWDSGPTSPTTNLCVSFFKQRITTGLLPCAPEAQQDSKASKVSRTRCALGKLTRGEGAAVQRTRGTPHMPPQLACMSGHATTVGDPWWDKDTGVRHYTGCPWPHCPLLLPVIHQWAPLPSSFQNA